MHFCFQLISFYCLALNHIFPYDYQEHGGGLNEAVNSYFTEGDTSVLVSFNTQIMLNFKVEKYDNNLFLFIYF